MKILIRKWKSVGIAGADQDVDLMQTATKPYRIGLFWLDSGGGKTTTHNLIKVCLTGDSSMIEDNWHKFERRYILYWTDNLYGLNIRPYKEIISNKNDARNSISWLSLNSEKITLGKHWQEQLPINNNYDE